MAWIVDHYQQKTMPFINLFVSISHINSACDIIYLTYVQQTLKPTALEKHELCKIVIRKAITNQYRTTHHTLESNWSSQMRHLSWKTNEHGNPVWDLHTVPDTQCFWKLNISTYQNKKNFNSYNTLDMTQIWPRVKGNLSLPFWHYQDNCLK